MIDNSEIKNYLVTIFGKQYILKRYQKMMIRGIYYIFLGIFEDEDNVPNVTSAYIVKNEFKLKTVRRASVPKTTPRVYSPEVRSVADDIPLNLSISMEDDELMVIMKSLLIKRGISIGQFKDLYGEDNKTDMNNDKSRLENKHTLSWNKFRFLLDKLNHEYDLLIYDHE